VKRSIQQVIDDIDALQTAVGEDHDRLDLLREEYFQSEDAGTDLDVWFRLYERLPDDDGTGQLTSILHNLEAHADYTRYVVKSLQRRPTRYPVLMLNRLLNRMLYEGYPAGFNDEFMLALLRQVAANVTVGADLREIAAEFIDEYKRNRDEADNQQP
jgi:hypothetical protein